MTAGLQIAQTVEEFSACSAAVSRVLDTQVRLPDWPFALRPGFVTLCEYDQILGGEFALVLDALADRYADDDVFLVVLEPDVNYYWRSYSTFPALRLSRAALPTGYWEGVSYEPQGDPTGAMAYTANVVAIAGSSGSWAVWGQRDWEVGLLLTSDNAGPWLSAGVTFLGARQAIDAFRAPTGWSKPLSEAESATFLRNVELYGSGA